MSGCSAYEKPRVEVIQVVQRRRWTVAEKARMVEESFQPGMNVSYVARRHGVAPNLLFRWRKLMAEGGKAALDAGEQVVSITEVRALKKQIRELECLDGAKRRKFVSKSAQGKLGKSRAFPLQKPGKMR